MSDLYAIVATPLNQRHSTTTLAPAEPVLFIFLLNDIVDASDYV
jgi:hypothetical protein